MHQSLWHFPMTLLESRACFVLQPASYRSRPPACAMSLGMAQTANAGPLTDWLFGQYRPTAAYPVGPSYYVAPGQNPSECGPLHHQLFWLHTLSPSTLPMGTNGYATNGPLLSGAMPSTTNQPAYMLLRTRRSKHRPIQPIRTTVHCTYSIPLGHFNTPRNMRRSIVQSCAELSRTFRCWAASRQASSYADPNNRSLSRNRVESTAARLLAQCRICNPIQSRAGHLLSTSHAVGSNDRHHGYSHDALHLVRIAGANANDLDHAAGPFWQLP